MQQHGIVHPLFPMLAKRSVLALAIFGLSLSFPAAVLAQQPAKAPAATPATGDQFNTYMSMAAINMCTLAQAKLPFKASMEGNLSMLTSVLSTKHGSQIQGAPAPLTREQLVNASVAETVLRIDKFCGPSLPPDWKKEVDTLVAQVKKAMQAAGSGGKK
jgi:hypothetical protein